MKKNKLIGLVASVMLLSSTVGYSADVDLEVGMDAARQGYYDYAASVFGSHADMGNGDAQFNIALMYHSGLGVSRDEQQAVEWYQKAAESGHSMAQAYLAAGYAEGWFGLERNVEKASYWSGKLPQANNAPAAQTSRGESKFGWGN